MSEQTAFNFDHNTAGGGAPVSAPKAWGTSAISACFGSQKQRWNAMSSDEQDALLGHMWAYSQARARAIANPVPAFDCESAMRGWVNADKELASVVRALNARFVPLRDIPAPGIPLRSVAARVCH